MLYIFSPSLSRLTYYITVGLSVSASTRPVVCKHFVGLLVQFPVSTNMAIKTTFCTLLFVGLLFVAAIQDAPGCNGGKRCIYAKAASAALGIQSRKVLVTLMGGIHGPTSSKIDDKLAFRELRAVPSGPDPLHHNGGGPKKPRTP